MGNLTWEKHEHEVLPLATSLAALLPQARRTAIDLAIDEKVRLAGEVVVINPDGPEPQVLFYRAGKYEKNPKHQLEAYIKTLVAAAQLAKPIGCAALGLDIPQPNLLAPVTPEEARKLIGVLLAGYWEGHRHPLCFAPKTSTALLEARKKGLDGPDLIDAAKSVWSQAAFGNQPGGEGTTPAALLAWRDADPFAPPLDADWNKWAESVASPLGSWWANVPQDETTRTQPKPATKQG